MKLANKALLLSAFTFPGAGHLFLKRYVSGALFVVGYIIILGFLITDIMNAMEPLITQLQSGDLLLAVDITKDFLLNHSLLLSESSGSTIYAMGIWFIALIDAYRLGLIADKNT